MYQVSNAYLTEMMSHSTRRRLTGTIGDVSFDENDIIKGTFEISNRCAEESDMKIGGVYIGTLEMTLVPSFLTKIPRDQLQGKDVTVSIGLKVGGEWIDVPCGIFTLQAPKISKNGIAVEGYDYMKKLDKKVGMSETAGRMYDFLQMIERECDVVLGMTQAEVESLPNGMMNISPYSENDIETYRDMLYWLAQTCGRFATINRSGELVLRKFGIPNDVILDEMHRDTDVVFSGYTTHWTGISIVDMETEMTNYYGIEPDDGLTMNLGQNPFLQYGLPEVKDQMRMAVLEEIADIEYTPFSVASARDPIFDLGDEINFEGGISGDSTGCVMSFVYNLTGYEFEGYGDDPALTDGRSKVDKNIAGLLAKTDSNSITYYSYRNIERMVIPENTEVTIGSLKFAAKKETEAVIQMEFKLESESTAEDTRTIVYHDEEIPDDPETEEDEEQTITEEIGYFDKNETPIIAHVRYYYDDILVDYEPIETWTEEGFHMLHGFYHLKNIDIETQHTWRVTLELQNGTAAIGINEAGILLNGQGLVGDERWDGVLDVADETGAYDIQIITAITLEDDFNELTDLVMQTAVLSDTEFDDEYDVVDITDDEAVDMADTAISVVIQNIVYNLISEDGEYNIVSADGVYNITTED